MSLPNDLVREILLKLPCFKSAVRLSCVCKSWQSLIKDPCFGDELFNNINQNHRNIKNTYDPSLVFIRQKVKIIGNPNYEYRLLSQSKETCYNAILFPVNVPQLEVVGSCNGILCFGENGPEFGVHLYNPITREHRVLPPSPFEGHLHGSVSPSNRRRPRRVLGFGADTRSSDYKVISIWGDDNGMKISSPYWRRIDDDANLVEIYKLSTNNWTRVDGAKLGDRFTVPDHGGALVNGCFHWLLENDDILIFDFGSERFQRMGNLWMGNSTSYRWQYDRAQWLVHLTALDDSLALCVSSREMSEARVWVMAEYGNPHSWTMRKFYVDELLRDLVTCWIHDANLVLLMFVGSLITCPPREEGRKEVRRTKLDCSYVRGAVFRPTLVSLLAVSKPGDTVDHKKF